MNEVLVRPGETFSVNAHVGPRTARRGFFEAPTIVHGDFEDTVGGGVSQFATTLFNALLRGGYEMVQRQPHTYYFRRYPLGHEATISYPEPDLIFKNDTKSGLLIRTEYSSTTIRVKIFGDNEGRKIKREVSKPFDFTDPKISFEPDPGMSPLEEKIVERGEKGFSVQTSRTVVFADGTEKTERRRVIYRSREQVLRIHPCRIPEGEPDYTGDDCPEVTDAGVVR
jgi:vancomycin resistance protein YoaR